MQPISLSVVIYNEAKFQTFVHSLVNTRQIASSINCTLFELWFNSLQLISRFILSIFIFIVNHHYIIIMHVSILTSFSVASDMGAARIVFWDYSIRWSFIMRHVTLMQIKYYSICDTVIQNNLKSFLLLSLKRKYFTKNFRGFSFAVDIPVIAAALIWECAENSRQSLHWFADYCEGDMTRNREVTGSISGNIPQPWAFFVNYFIMQ